MKSDLKALVAVDIDGTVRPPGGASPTVPHRRLSRLLRRLQGAGYTLAGATGASLKSARRAERGYRFKFLAHSYCWRLVERGQADVTTHVLVPDDELEAVTRLQPRLNEICRRHRGTLCDEAPCFTSHLHCARAFDDAAREVEDLIRGVKQVRLLANACDFGITVVAASANKSRAVEWLCEQGHTIAVAAGDTISDLPLLMAARFPIVTRTDSRTELDSELVKFVRRNGGFIADRENGKGLYDGLLAAREAGVLMFDLPSDKRLRYVA